MSPKAVYQAYVTTILVVALALALYTMVGGFDRVPPMTIPQMGTVVESSVPVDSFHDSATLDPTQVEKR